MPLLRPLRLSLGRVDRDDGDMRCVHRCALAHADLIRLWSEKAVQERLHTDIPMPCITDTGALVLTTVVPIIALGSTGVGHTASNFPLFGSFM